MLTLDLDPSWPAARVAAVLQTYLMAHAQLIGRRAPLSAQGVFLVLFQQRHHIGRAEYLTVPHLAQLVPTTGGRKPYSERQIYSAVAWLLREGFAFRGRGDVLLLAPVYLAGVYASQQDAARAATRARAEGRRRPAPGAALLKSASGSPIKELPCRTSGTARKRPYSAEPGAGNAIEPVGRTATAPRNTGRYERGLYVRREVAADPWVTPGEVLGTGPPRPPS